MSTLQALLEQVDALKAQVEALRPLARDIEERVMQKFRLWWTYHSNAIEGNVLTQGETEMFLMEGLTAKGKPLKDHLDLRGHNDAIRYLFDLIKANAELSEADIREIHKILLVEPYRTSAITPDGKPTTKQVALGQYKLLPNYPLTKTGETHFYASPEETPAKMGDLMKWYRDETAHGVMHPVEIAARFHHQFTAIHPFDDGNGRMSRLMMNLLLMQKSLPPAVIRINERDQYIAALSRADSGEPEDFLCFIAEHVVSSLNLYLRAAKGEEIHEQTDLEKEIALLKMELKHIEEPETLTQAIQKSLFEKSLDPLFAEIGRLMQPLCELFSEDEITYSETHGRKNAAYHNTGTAALAGARGAPRSEGCWSEDFTIKNLHATFALKGFKKGRFDAFDITAALTLSFDPLKYKVEITTPRFIIQHFYQEALSSDEITEIAQKLTRTFLDAIKKKTSESS